MSEQTGYWSRKLMDRRAALRSGALAGGGLAAATLIACGGGGGTKGASTKAGESAGDAKTGGSPLDATKGKPGGTYKYTSVDAGGLNVVDRANNWHFAGLVFEGLTALKWGIRGVAYDDYTFEPALATALPEQPDPQTYIFKLRPGVKFHNGHAFTSEDVKYSYDRWANFPTSIQKATWQTWYDRVETPDPLTAVLKTKVVFADTLEATTANQYNYIFDHVYEETPESQTKPVGTGPFVFESYTPTVSATFKKNPDFYQKPYPYFDRLELYTTTDVVKRVTDFATRQVDQPWLVYAEDREKIRQARPDAVLCAVNPYCAPSIFMRTDQAAFKDQRVRQALSMSIDREKIDGAVNHGEGQDDQYFSLQFQKLNATSAVKDLGDAARYWKYDVAEAKKLFSAAGVNLPIESQISSWDGSVLGQFFPDIATLTIAQWRENGIANLKHNPMTAPQYNGTVARGQYEGMGLAVNTGIASGSNRGQAIKDTLYWGPNGEHSPLNITYVNNPQLNDLAIKQLSQLNVQERQATFRQIEKIIADQQYRLVYRTLSQNWFFDPGIANAWMPQDQGSRRYMMKWWLNKTP